MIKIKYKYVSIILLFITIISLAIISLDLGQVFLKETVIINLFYELSSFLKTIFIFLTAVLVFSINKNGLNMNDTFRLRIIYLMILFGDVSLVLDKKPYLGIFFFSIVHILLILRNGQISFSKKIDREKFNGHRVLFFSGIIAYLLGLFLIFLVLKRINVRGFFLILLLYYFTILFLSLYTGILNYKLALFPKINSSLLVIGLVAFFLCDICVGTNIAFGYSKISLITRSIIWLFYCPALTLIGLSGYKF